MRSLVQWAVGNSPALNTIMVGILAVGAFCLATMRREVFPEFELEIILVTVPYPGASPDEIEDGICQKIEEAVRSIAGIKKQTAVAQEGSGFMVLELESSVRDVQKVLNEVRSEIDRIPSFPELAEDPEIKQITLRDPAIKVGVIGPITDGIEAELTLREITERVRGELLRLPTVSQADIVGGRDYQIDIEIPEDTLRKYGLTLQQVASIVRRENVELPGGTMKTDSEQVLLRGKHKRLVGEEIAQIPLVTQPNGVVLTVGDLGRVNDAFADETAINEVDGQPSLVVSVNRASNEDLLAMVQDVKQYVKSAELPLGYSLRTWGDRSVDVRDRMDLLLRNGLQGLALVFLVLAVFLDLRLAFWVALGIPIAILGAGIALLYLGQTMNMLSMFAFLMALGIVVDDAIVIGENIYEHRQLGKNHVKAAVEGTLEVLPSVVASVSTTLIAFIPLMFVSGVMGKFIAVMPVAVIAMLLISLVESTFILPCHLAHSKAYDPSHGGVFPVKVRRFCQRLPIPLKWTLSPILVPLAYAAYHMAYPFQRLGDWVHFASVAATRFLSWIVHRFYKPTIRWCVRHPATVICAAVSTLLVSVGIVRAGITPFELFPKLDSNEILARITFPDGTPSSVTDQATRKLADAVSRIDAQRAAEGHPLTKTIRRSVGQVAAPGIMGPDQLTSGSHVGTVEVELVSAEKREVTSDDILTRWREEAGEFVGAEEVVFGTPQFGPGGAQIEFKLLANSDNFDQLEKAVEECKKRLAQYPGVVDIRDDSRPGKWEFQLQVKDSAVAMGIPLAELAETVRASYYGQEVMRLQRGRHEVKLMVRYPVEERRRLSDFANIRVRADDGAERPITELADVKVTRGYTEINRVNQRRSITITADVVKGVANAYDVVNDLQANFMSDLLDQEQYQGVGVRWEGQREQSRESIGSLMKGFVIAMLAMYVLLTVEFRSYLQPLIILAIIPFGAVGAIWGHALMGMPLTMFTMFGLVALTGVVVNDSIVLIDFINHRLADGLDIDAALTEAGARRFRPVLLTSITTIAGLSPMLMETSFQAQVLIPMAATLVYGLIVATAMVLVLVPTCFSVYWRILHLGSSRSVPALPARRELPVTTDVNVEPVLTERN